ncbi:MAG: glutathione S-transferase family protein [Kiloniellales bacterium]|nr:glutathione S-transferase family protein [Kiloniellales bacterium]
MYTLYWAPRTAAFAPQAILEEAGAAYETVAVDLDRGEQDGAAYRALNPGATVPTLVTEDGLVVTESAAILLWLAERHPETALLPEPGGAARATLLRWLFYLTNTVQASYRRYYYPERFSTEPADAPRIKAKAKADLLTRWKAVEAQLAESGPFLLGAQISAADIYLLMLARWFDPKDELPAACPAVGRCADLVAERPAVRRALEAGGYL